MLTNFVNRKDHYKKLGLWCEIIDFDLYFVEKTIFRKDRFFSRKDHYKKLGLWCEIIDFGLRFVLRIQYVFHYFILGSRREIVNGGIMSTRGVADVSFSTVIDGEFGILVSRSCLHVIRKVARLQMDANASITSRAVIRLELKLMRSINIITTRRLH